MHNEPITIKDYEELKQETVDEINELVNLAEGSMRMGGKLNKKGYEASKYATSAPRVSRVGEGV